MELTDATLALILEKLAAFFGTAVETVQAQLPTLLASYARYEFVSSIGENIFIGILVSLGIAVVVFGIGMSIWDEIKGYMPNWYTVIAIILIIIAATSPNIIELLKWQAWPEYYAIEAILQTLK